jgi:hypothetical protein
VSKSQVKRSIGLKNEQKVATFFTRWASFSKKKLLTNIDKNSDVMLRSHNLESMYKNTNVNLCKIVDSIFDIGSIELFDEDIEGDSNATLKSLGIVIDLCEHNKITMLSPDIVKKFNFNEYGGWGGQFNRNDIDLFK